MSIFSNKKEETGIEVRFEPDMLFIRLADGHEVGIPLMWHPKLRNATHQQRNNWQFINQTLYWEELDESISVQGLV